MRISRKQAGVIAALTIGLVGIFYLFNLGMQRAVAGRASTLAISQGETIAKVMQLAVANLLEKGESNLISFLKDIQSNEAVIYTALARQRKLFFAVSEYEGYLPIDVDKTGINVFDSPQGKVLEVSVPFQDRSGMNYLAFIGYSFTALDEIERMAQRNLFLLSGVQAVLLLAMVWLLMGMNRQVLRKELEVRHARDERERYLGISLVTSGIMHEIKNPLNSLYLNFQMLEPLIDSSKPEACYHAESLRKEVKRINEIIERFSGFRRGIKVNKEKVALQSLVDDVVSGFKRGGEKCEFASHFTGVEEIDTDHDLLIQALINLINNAVEAGAGRIEIEVHRLGNQIIIQVADDGGGIAADLLTRIFEPYVSGKAHGSGIGLALVRKILQVLGGEIDAANRPGGGAIFTLTLPQ